MGLNRLELRKRLYQYSVSVPEFYLKYLIRQIRNHEFKGFYVLRIEKKEDVNDFKELGLDWFVRERLKGKTEEDEVSSQI